VLGKTADTREALIIEVIAGDIAGKQSLITRIGILSFPGALLAAIDLTIFSTCLHSTPVKVNCSEGRNVFTMHHKIYILQNGSGILVFLLFVLHLFAFSL
jgi:hypothetical protein